MNAGRRRGCDDVHLVSFPLSVLVKADDELYTWSFGPSLGQMGLGKSKQSRKMVQGNDTLVLLCALLVMSRYPLLSPFPLPSILALSSQPLPFTRLSSLPSLSWSPSISPPPFLIFLRYSYLAGMGSRSKPFKLL